MDDRDVPSREDLQHEVERLRAENRRPRANLERAKPAPAELDLARPAAWEPTLFRDGHDPARLPEVDGQSSPEAKVALFRSLFLGREDVHAVRWESERTGKSGWSPAVVGG